MSNWLIILLVAAAIAIVWYRSRSRPDAKPGEPGHGIDDEIATAVGDVVREVMHTDPDKNSPGAGKH